jgi:hypothetical protein
VDAATCREKASQVLRDAVSIDPQPTSADALHQSIAGVPSLDETAASSFENASDAAPEVYLRPAPDQSRVKRARISHWDEGVLPTQVPSNDAISPRRHASSTGTVQVRPPALLTADARNSSTATAGSLLGDVHAEVHSGLLSEFDLFNGGLLDVGDAAVAPPSPRQSQSF